jgi:hypothetical protein
VVGRQVHYPTAPVPDLVSIETFVTYLWYGVGAGDGLRSVGAEALPPSKGACSILPTARHFWAGARTLHPARWPSAGRGILSGTRPFISPLSPKLAERDLLLGNRALWLPSGVNLGRLRGFLELVTRSVSETSHTMLDAALPHFTSAVAGLFTTFPTFVKKSVALESAVGCRGVGSFRAIPEDNL